MNLYCLGDIGSYSSDLKKIIKHFIKKYADSENNKIVLLGDNFYPFGVKNPDGAEWNKFKNIFKTDNTNIYAILGNHDYFNNPKAQIDSNYWTMPDYFYFKQINNIGLWFIDTQILDPGDSNSINPFLNLYDNIDKYHSNYIKIFNNQLNWLESTFESYNNLDIKIVFGHYPIISGGIYDKNEKLYSILMPLFYKYNITAYISGHDHNLQHLQLKIHNYSFNQFISGCNDQEHVYNIQNDEFKESGFFSAESGYLKIYSKPNMHNMHNNLIFEFKSAANKTLYKYKNPNKKPNKNPNKKPNKKAN